MNVFSCIELSPETMSSSSSKSKRKIFLPSDWLNLSSIIWNTMCDVGLMIVRKWIFISLKNNFNFYCILNETFIWSKSSCCLAFTKRNVFSHAPDIKYFFLEQLQTLIQLSSSTTVDDTLTLNGYCKIKTEITETSKLSNLDKVSIN